MNERSYVPLAYELIHPSQMAQLASQLTLDTMHIPMPSSVPAPWRNLFLEHVGAMKSPLFTLSTIRRVHALETGGGGGEHHDQDYEYAPRARTCVFRGTWASLPANPKNEAERNPDIYESELPVFTTDARMDKMAELLGGGGGSGGGGGDATNLQPGQPLVGSSGGGGPVEAAFWAEGARVQWRIRGRAYVLGPDVEESEGGRKTQELLRAWMRRGQQQQQQREDQGGEEMPAKDKEGTWSFGREVTAHFGNLSPIMRGSFKNPPPGTPVVLPVEGGLRLGQEVTDLQDEVARKNFRVVVIVPSEVDRTDLSDPERGRRWIYRFVGAGEATKPRMPGGEVIDGWEKVEVWP
ncbi:pyridoxamine 5'-phosphate oxidase-domain-containing protein [Xylariales sp. PMI_506]|nr:pyridoxamine 5'-phosphate oxidase-domain-containing protein [Xylariales sp. PMI_506]